jgi:hypothetical protein
VSDLAGEDVSAVVACSASLAGLAAGLQSALLDAGVVEAAAVAERIASHRAAEAVTRAAAAEAGAGSGTGALPEVRLALATLAEAGFTPAELFKMFLVCPELATPAAVRKCPP